jgi:hypothetical protein
MPAHCKDRPQAPKKLEGEALQQQRARLHAQLEQVERANAEIERSRGNRVADLAADSADFFHRLHAQEQDGQAVRGSLEDANEAYRKQVGPDNLPPRGASQQTHRKPAWMTGQPRR